MRRPLVSKQQPGDEHIQDCLHQSRDQIKACHDKLNQRQHALLSADQHVYTQDQNTKLWEPSVIVQATKEPRSYLVKYHNGNVQHGNRQFLRPARRELTRSDLNIDGNHPDNTKQYTTLTKYQDENNKKHPAASTNKTA